MNITDVQIFLSNEDKLRAYATITIDGCFIIRDLKVIEGTTGLFVAMPAKKRKDGHFKDIAHPLNQETRAYIEEKVFEAYNKHVANGHNHHAHGGHSVSNSPAMMSAASSSNKASSDEY